jgi:4'-phosphopantetheinyl transferase
MPSWDSPLPHLGLPRRTVHVWYASLQQSIDNVRRFAGHLSEAEQTRVSRLHFERDRRRFTVARGLLRHLLGQYLNVAPDRVEFIYGTHGKPRLAEIHRNKDLHFNVSHAGERALYAVALGAPIGIDLEYMRPLDDMERTARLVFSAREQAELFGLDPVARLAGFYNGWTRKEAYLKALGSGLASSLAAFSVRLDPDRPAELVAIDGDVEEPSRWTIHALALEHPYVGALALRRRAWRVPQRYWSELTTWSADADPPSHGHLLPNRPVNPDRSSGLKVTARTLQEG